MSSETEDNGTANQKAVIGSLLNDADPLTKIVISAYNPTAKYNVNLQNIRRFNADHIEAAATFLGFKVRAESKKLYKNLTILSDRVILKIESLFESTCLDCGETYCNTLNSETPPPFTCHLCLQGSHTCDKVKEKAKSSPRPGGTVWLCFDCYRKNDLALLPTEAVKSAAVKKETEDKTEDDEDDEEEVDEDDRVSPRRGRQQEPKSTATEGIVCERYKKRECPHGLTGKRLIDGKPCPHKHPRRCFRWCKQGDNRKLGCTKGDDCRYFHPKLCHNSVLKRFCANQNCTFHHLKHTRRPREEKSARSNNYNPGNGKPPPAPTVPKVQPRWDSVSTLNGTPYAPTIQRRGNAEEKQPDQPTRRNANQPDHFLLRYLENMKEGFVIQMSEKLMEFQASIPELVREQVLASRPSAPPMPMYQFPPQQQLSYAQAAQQHAPAQNFQNQFHGCSY